MPETTTDTTTSPTKVARGVSKKSTPTAKAGAPKPAEVAKPITYGRYQPDDVITVLVDNPKKGDSRKRFEVYGPKGSKMTVADYIKKVGRIGIGDLRWDTDTRRKFIEVRRGGSPVA